MTNDERRAAERLKDLLNGDWDDMDPLTRRALIIFGGEIDGLQSSIRALHEDLAKWRADQDHRERRRGGQMINLYVAVITTIGTVIVASIATFG